MIFRALLSALICSVVCGLLAPRDKAPDFTTVGVVDGKFQDVTLSQYLKQGKYVVLFFFPFSYTFVCPTEILAFSEQKAKWEELNTQVLGVSCDSHHVQLAWTRSPRKDGGLGQSVSYPLLGDHTRDIANKYEVLTKDPTVGWYGAPLRAVFVIDPTGTIRSTMVNDEQVGRSIDEVIRLVEGFRYSDSHKGEGCPANWKPGKQTIEANPFGSKKYFSSDEYLNKGN